ncbi:MAG: hypothetical protein Q9221_003352 [Calogaya cf. arnoldii]
MSHSIGIILKWFVGSCPWYINTAFASFGWWMMVTGFAMVLYCRLHLVIRNPNTLRAVLTMTIFNFTIFQVPTTILTFASNQANPGMWLKVYNVYERIQLIVFTLQELAISILYIRAAFQILLPDDPSETRITKQFLIYSKFFCIILDIAFVCEVCSDEWVYKTGTQSLAYANKLTIEFVVLNKLRDVYRIKTGSCVVCKRRLASSGQANSRTQPSMGHRASSGQGVIKATWVRSKVRGIKPLGLFDEGMMDYKHYGQGVSIVRAGPESPKQIEGSAKDIVVTTGISMWSENLVNDNEEEQGRF